MKFQIHFGLIMRQELKMPYGEDTYFCAGCSQPLFVKFNYKIVEDPGQSGPYFCYNCFEVKERKEGREAKEQLKKWRVIADKLAVALQEVEWVMSYQTANSYCPWCGNDDEVNSWRDQMEHTYNCWRQIALTEYYKECK